MIFEIKRTSQWFFDKNRPPCDGAFSKDNCWVIELNTLEDLLNFQNEIGEEIVIGNLNDSFGENKDTGIKHYIEIYDDYRE